MKNVKYTNSAQYRCLENLHESFVDLHLVHCGIEHCEPNHTYGPALRREYIIHFVLSGKGSYTVNGITYYLTENQMFLICPDEEILYTADGEDPWVYAWIGVNGIRAESSLKKCGLSRDSYVRPFKNPECMVEQITNILNTSQLTFANDFKRNSFLLMLLALLMENYDILNRSNKTLSKYNYSSNIYLEQAITYIKQKHSFGINVSDVADYVGISRTYLNQIFQKELGISSQKFLVDFRLHKAANLLISTGLSVADVSELVGYDDPLAFSKAFKKKFGLSPKYYRNHKDSLDLFHEKQIGSEL